jgi:hypothetical protein
MISVSFPFRGLRDCVMRYLIDDISVGLISQVAEELWEVANKTIKNLTKYDISIVDYKKNLVKQSQCSLILAVTNFLISFLM